MKNEGFRDPIVNTVDEGEYDEELVMAEDVVRPCIVSSTATTTTPPTETTTASPTATTTVLPITPAAPREPRRRLRSG